MTDQRGRCTNVEFCTVAVSQKTIVVSDGDAFVCPKCNEPLLSVSEKRSASRKKLAMALQAIVVVAGGGAIAWRVWGVHPEASAMTVASLTTPGSTIVSGSSFTAPVPTAPAPVLAVPAPVIAVSAPVLAALAPVQASAPVPVAAPVAIAPPPAVVAIAEPVPVPAPRLSPPSILLRVAAPMALGTGLERRLASGYLSLIGDTAVTTEAKGNDMDVIGTQAGVREAIRIAPAASDAAFSALLHGTTDIAISMRRVTPAEAERLVAIGDLTSPANEHVIGVQGVAVIVSPGNRVVSLTTGQVRDVLTGRITDWADLGGQPGPIHLHVLDIPEGQVDAPQDMLLKGALVVASAERDATEAALASAVAADRAALGVVAVGSSGSARVVSIAENGAMPVMPTDLAVATEDYPLTRRVYFYHRGDATTGYVRRFLDYVASPTGQAAVEAAGLVSLNLRTERVAVPELASDRFKQYVTGASRVSVDFRFQLGSTELDGRGARDLERLVAFIRSRRVAPERLILAAFADNSGAPAVNQLTSQRRAEAVAAALARQGMQVGRVAGFGSEFPVADNATTDGRERNRRVEVYLAP